MELLQREHHKIESETEKSEKEEQECASREKIEKVLEDYFRREIKRKSFFS